MHVDLLPCLLLLSSTLHAVGPQILFYFCCVPSLTESQEALCPLPPTPQWDRGIIPDQPF
jgi:hypothetical protein